MKTVLITGAAGEIGSRLRRELKGVYPSLRLSDRRKPDDLADGETFIPADLSDKAAVEKMVEGVDGILHFGGQAYEGDWDTVLQSNIIGCYNVFEAAHRAGVKRIVFASSNHAVGFYPRRHRIGTDVTTRPDSRYGVSKAFGEALGALYAYKHGMRVTCLRIGNFGEVPLDHRRLGIWLSPDDTVQLARIGLDHPDIKFEIFYGVSDNERCWFDMSNAYRFGYRPTGRSEEFRDQALAAQAKLPNDPVGDWYQGGTFCSAEYDNKDDVSVS
jgi:uronate dehydrogenase